MKKRYNIVLLITLIIISPSYFISTNKTINSDDISGLSTSQAIIPFVVGVNGILYELDPQLEYSDWRFTSFAVIDQVCEGLFAYNLSDPDQRIIPRLATSLGTWNVNGDELTIPLRMGVMFHDGTPFNADAVLFMWNRMAWAMNLTGTNTNVITYISEYYTLPNGTSIVKQVIKNNDYSVTFKLNGPYAPFEALLCFSGSYILSPTSTPATAYIDSNTGDLVGTGPFVYDGYTPHTEVNFHAYNNYWRGKANIEEMIFSIITNHTERNSALLAGNIDFLQDPMEDMLDTFGAHPKITVLDSGKESAKTQYLGMNNMKIERNLRRAISYAIDYTYIIDELFSGTVKRMKSPIPKGIIYSNTTFPVPTFNIPSARYFMQTTMGYGIGWDNSYPGTHESSWSAASFVTINYTYDIGSGFREDLLSLLQTNLDKIGITVLDDGMPFSDYIYRLYEWFSYNRNMLDLFWIRGDPDFRDANWYINDLLTNRSRADNYAQYNGWQAAIEDGRNPNDVNDNVQLLMEAALTEINHTQRKRMYDRIQELLITRDMPWAWGVVDKLYDAHHIKLAGFQQNAFKKLDFYSCTWDPYYDYLIQLSHPADITYVQGVLGHTIEWNITATDLLNSTYSIYQDLTLKSNGSWSSGIPVTVNVDALATGNYAFRIEVHNENEIAEDIVILIVTTPAGPEIFVYLTISFIGISMVCLVFIYRKLRKKSKIS